MANNLVTLPQNLKIGFASASYQIEGAWNKDGKIILFYNSRLNITNTAMDNE